MAGLSNWAVPAVSHAVHLHVGGLVLVLLLATVTTTVARRFRLPYTVALVLVGLLVDVLGLLPGITLTADVILYVLLPPLLFEAALDVDLDILGRALPAILLLAVPGVIVSAVIIGVAVSALTPLTIWPALLFGALISATDPVSVVSTFRQLGAPADLTMTVEGESVFNDGTALVLSALLLTAAQTGKFNGLETLLLFGWSIAGGLGLGAIGGFLASRISTYLHDESIEISQSTILAYGTYLLADWLHASGVLAVVAAALVFGSLQRHSHSAESHASLRRVEDFWGYVGFLANAILFILIGLTIRLVALQQNARWILIAIAAILVARALVVYTLTLGLHRISLAYGHVLFWGALRGGVALAVALSLPPMPGRSLIQALTFGVVLFTILIQGLTIDPLAARLGLLRENPATHPEDALEGPSRDSRLQGSAHSSDQAQRGGPES